MTEINIAFPSGGTVEMTATPETALRLAPAQPVVLSATDMGLTFPAPQAVTLVAAPALALTFPAPQAVTLQAMGIQGSPGTGGGATSFETVSRNLDAEGAVITPSTDGIASIAYASGVTKTFTYGPDGLAVITLSGATPGGIELTKTLTYTVGELTGFTYS